MAFFVLNMKKKKQRHTNIVAFTPFQTIFRPRRRRLLLQNLLSVLCVLTASLVFLFLLAILFFVSSPAVVDNHNPDHSVQSSFNANTLFNSTNIQGQNVLPVPTSGGSLGESIWSSRKSSFYYGCSDPGNNFPTAEAITRPKRYLMIATSGGLNQQRTGITDAVVVARILNAALVVPKLDQRSFWKDTSNFAEIFNIDWFIKSLSKDVKIIKQLPNKRGKLVTPHTMRVRRKCNPRCYETQVLPILNKKHAVQLTKFDYRLANQLPKDLQKLRCRVNYHALRFTDPILEMGEKLIRRMRMKSDHFVALHLRFEPDMLAFSGCYYGGGEKERKELGAIRKRWKTLHTRSPEKERRHGKCPLSPEEVGLMLRALGFGNEVHIYVASGEVYRGEETLAPLKALFPNFHSKESLASKEELAPFSHFSSRMAALDFIVCDGSDVFVTNNNGNMARILAGRRRYFGHKPTIRPNAKKLYKLFLNRGNISWEEFSSEVRTSQIGFMGEPNEVGTGVGEFHENPSSCICEKSEARVEGVSSFQSKVTKDYRNSTDEIRDADVDDQSEDEHEWIDPDYVENEIDSTRKVLPNRTNFDNLLLGYDQQELEELFSD